MFADINKLVQTTLPCLKKARQCAVLGSPCFEFIYFIRIVLDRYFSVLLCIASFYFVQQEFFFVRWKNHENPNKEKYQKRFLCRAVVLESFVLMLMRWWNDVHSRDLNGTTTTTTAIFSTLKSILCLWKFQKKNSYSVEWTKLISPAGAEPSWIEMFPFFPPQIFFTTFMYRSPSCRPLTSAFSARRYVKLT